MLCFAYMYFLSNSISMSVCVIHVYDRYHKNLKCLGLSRKWNLYVKIKRWEINKKIREKYYGGEKVSNEGDWESKTNFEKDKMQVCNSFYLCIFILYLSLSHERIMPVYGLQE